MAYLPIEKIDHGEWRDEILCAVNDRPRLDGDAVVTILEREKMSPEDRLKVPIDTRFGFTRAPENDNRAIKQLEFLIDALVTEPKLLEELARLDNMLEGELSHDRYNSIEQERRLIRSELARLRDRGVALNEIDTEL